MSASITILVQQSNGRVPRESYLIHSFWLMVTTEREIQTTRDERRFLRDG
jgi:hypothetical protein